MPKPSSGDLRARRSVLSALGCVVAIGLASTADAAPNDLLIARLSPAQAEAARLRSDIRLLAPLGDGRWVYRAADPTGTPPGTGAAPLEVESRIDPALRTVYRHGELGGTGPVLPCVIIPVDRERPARRTIDAMVRAWGGAARLIESDSLTMRVDLDPSGLARLVASGEILWIEPWSEPGTDDRFVRDFGGANTIETIEGFTGTGVVVEVVDKGLFPDHMDFLDSSPVFRTLNDGPTDHGTSTYGIIFGSGSADAEARGMMPGQTGLFSSYLEVEDRHAHFCTLVGDYGGVIQSNSWGSGITRRYTALTAELDDAIKHHGVLVFQSQSNRGNPDSRPEAWAKNAISVGGINGWGTLDRADDSWGGDASTGPAIDGRIKPDLTLFNDGILTTSDVDETAFEVFTGTSAATPAVAGHAGIMFEMWRAGFFHGGDAGAVPSTEPSVAMSRAILVNSARSYEFGDAADDLGRYRQGWGTPDLVSIWAGGPKRWISDEEAPLASGEGWSRVFKVEPGEPALGITLAWSEPAAMPFAVRSLVNDIDLRVISPSGVVYLGNHGLHDGTASAPGGTADGTNPLENVFIDHPEAGEWQVDVTARTVAIDAWDATPEIDAAFALVATGVSPVVETRLVRFVGDIPERVDPRSGEVFEFEIEGFEAQANGELRIRWGNQLGALPLTQVSPGRFRANITGLKCRRDYSMLAVLRTPEGRAVSFPRGGANGWLPIRSVRDEQKTPSQLGGWHATQGPGVASGGWEHGMPAGGGMHWDPPFDADGDGTCWMTDNRAGSSDVSGGVVTLQTPIVSYDELDEPAVEFDLWYVSDMAGTPDEETMRIEVSYGFGGPWQPLAEERSTYRWAHARYPLETDATLVSFRFSVGGGESHVEAAIDGFSITGISCPPCRPSVDPIEIIEINGLMELYNGGQLSAGPDGHVFYDLDDLVGFIAGLDEDCDP